MTFVFRLFVYNNRIKHGTYIIYQIVAYKLWGGFIQFYCGLVNKITSKMQYLRMANVQ